LPILDNWWRHGTVEVRIGVFWNMARVILGGDAEIDMLGNLPYRYVFVETGGEIEGLDVDKWFTIRNVYYGRAHKIFMQFSRRWWVDDYAISHGVTVTDLAIRNVVYTAGQTDNGRAGLSRPTPGSRTAWLTVR
jgi:hypothetical protein